MKTPQKYLDAAKKARRSKPGRRAKQVFLNGSTVLVPVKKEVPTRQNSGFYKPCAKCPRKTMREPNADGVRLCFRCSPTLKKLVPGKVYRKCIRCDAPIVKGVNERGPWFCGRCQKTTSNGHYHPTGYETNPAEQYTPERAERVKALAKMYGEVQKYPTESAARRAGLPTTSEELPQARSATDDTATDGVPDEDDD